jgi:hypothetical protein
VEASESGGPFQIPIGPVLLPQGRQVERIGGNIVRGKGRPGRAEARRRRHTDSRVPVHRLTAPGSPGAVRLGSAVVHEPNPFTADADELHDLELRELVNELHFDLLILRGDDDG